MVNKNKLTIFILTQKPKLEYNMKIKSLDTKLFGYNFRSRLEARWAIFFKEMGWDCLYEPQGYRLENGDKYLPDFYLPDFQTFLEVKFNVLNEFDFDRASMLVSSTHIPLVILDRDPSLKHLTQLTPDDEGGVSAKEINLVEDPKSKGNFLKHRLLVDEEDYININQIAPIKASLSHPLFK